MIASNGAFRKVSSSFGNRFLRGGSSVDSFIKGISGA